MVRRTHGHGGLCQLFIFKVLGTVVLSNLPSLAEETDVIPGGLWVKTPGFIQR